MKQIIDGGTYIIEGQSFRIWGDSDSRKVFKQILDSGYDQLCAMLSHHSRVLVIRFDFRVSEYSQDNAIISDFYRVLVKQLKFRYRMKRIGYMWAREQATSERQHYHCVLLLDANKVNYPDSVINRIQRIVEFRGLPCVWFPEHCYYTVHRGDLNSFSEAFFRISYLAKVETKQRRVGSVNDYSTSRIKHKDEPICSLALAS